MAAYMRHVRLSGQTLIHQCRNFQPRVNSLHTASHRFIQHDLQATLTRSHGGLTSGLLRRPVIVCGGLSCRWNSTQSTGEPIAATPGPLESLPEGYIPEPPPIPLPTVPEVPLDLPLNALGEPTMQALGLAKWTPPGFVQWGLENLHVGLDLPWWGAIVAGTIVVRLCIFPLVIMAQRNAAQMHNHMPTVQRLQEKFTKTRQSGNVLEAARVANELQDYMKRNNVRPGRSMMVPLAQMPIFVSVFVGLRAMANLPVESMKEGGLLWFVDLTTPDPIYLLPFITMATFLVTIELGVDGVKAQSMSHTIKWVMRGMPIIMFPLIINFPSAMLCYWMTTNFFSLCQVLFLKIPTVREFFKIPAHVKHPESTQKANKKGFVEGFKETWNNSKLVAEVEDRQRMESVRWKEAGEGPLTKTYRYDPTKTQIKKQIKQG